MFAVLGTRGNFFVASADSDLFPSKRFSRGGLSLCGLGPIGTDLQLNHSSGGGGGNNSNPYERWSNGNDGNANKQQHLLYGSGSNGDAATVAAAQAAAVAAAHHHAAAQMAALTKLVVWYLWICGHNLCHV